LEADDLKATCAYGTRLSQIKRVDPLVAAQNILKNA
jgi:hypothetical protein